MSHYFTIDQALYLIDEPYQSACRRLLRDTIQLVQKMRETPNHHTWPGGYYDHVQEVLNLAIVLFYTLNKLRPLPFTLSDLLIVVFVHGIETAWRYELREDGQLYPREGMDTKADFQQFRMQKLRKYGIELTPEQENGIAYVEGEIVDYSNCNPKMGQLAAVAHMCNVASARLWSDHPLEGGDPWRGAIRCRSSEEC